MSQSPLTPSAISVSASDRRPVHARASRPVGRARLAFAHVTDSELECLVSAVTSAGQADFALVGIDGMGGSGKSTLAAELAERIGAVVVHGDDFYRPMPPAVREQLSPREGYERNFDWQRLRDEVLAPLASGRDAAYQRYDWTTRSLAPDELHTVRRSGVVVVEGVYVGRPELEHFYDLLVWVDTPPEVSWQRLRERGDDHGPIDWEARWRLANEHYVAATNPPGRAHITVKGDRDCPNRTDQP